VEALRRIGRIEPGSYPLRPIVPSPRPLHYRSRAKFHVDRAGERLVFFRRRSHDPVLLRSCALLEAGLDRLREAMGPALSRARLRPAEVALEWSAHDGRGSALLRGLEPGEEALRRCRDLLAILPELAGVIVEGEPDGRRGRPTAVVGDPLLLQERVPGDPAAGLARSRPDVFQQANRGANAFLVAAALDLLRPDGEEVLELFCGPGNFTGPLARRAAAVSAVEGQGPAIELARADLGRERPFLRRGSAAARGGPGTGGPAIRRGAPRPAARGDEGGGASPPRPRGPPGGLCLL
jgi:23S rRNA (uracil1939-C5)-methyltransferase